MSLRLIQRFGRSLTLTRKTVGGYVDGKFTPGVPAQTTFMGCPQPLTAKEQEFAPEGNDGKERRKLYTTTELKIQKDAVGSQVQEADVVTIDGQDFQVIQVESQNYPGKMTIQYYKAIVEAL